MAVTVATALRLKAIRRRSAALALSPDPCDFIVKLARLS